MIYTIFNTSNKTLYNVITQKKHAYSSLPTQYPLKQGDIILLSDDNKQIHFIAIYHSYTKDTFNYSKNFFPKDSGNTKQWDYIINFSDVKKLSYPLNLLDLKCKSYIKTQTFSYVTDSIDVDTVSYHIINYL